MHLDPRKDLVTRYLKRGQVLKKLTIEHEKLRVEDEEVKCVIVRGEVRGRNRGSRDTSSDSSRSSCSESSEENQQSNHFLPEIVVKTKDHNRRVL